ncbi:hypothetical protein [Flexithrix dorotheae]|uniref:hypothetical protein n=1 Tax=Flexithrix dorotheae TaxID=70993 RepID=UPI000360DEB3|nr:hypothetical protein [Flexithrix dorotheae]
MAEKEDTSVFYNFVRNVETAINNLVTLEIKTIVGDYKVDEEENISVKKEGEFQILQTRINLMQGDMITNISNDLVTDRYAWLRDFHARKEERGHEIINNNIQTIMSIFDLYKKSKGVNLNEENIDEEEDAHI